MKWIKYNQHIALQNGDEILHPDSSEIYLFMENGGLSDGIINPLDAFPDMKISKIGAPINCEIKEEDDNIVFDLYIVKNKVRYPVDMVQGMIIDHCICDDYWVYLTGDINHIQTVLENAHVVHTGVISIGQYLDLLKQDFFSANKDIDNQVELSFIKKKIYQDTDVPAGIQANLYEYQRIGFNWIKTMLGASHGCILGDEMGLGKTLQIITVFQDLKDNGEIPALVVAPVSLLENWNRECGKFAPELDLYVHHGSKRTGRYQELQKHDIVVISYNTAVSDLSMLKMIDWSCVVLDEAQNIKNPYSERAKSVKLITRKNSIAVTGTPFENHITDIWSLVDFSIPGLLGEITNFKDNVSDDLLGAEKIEPILSPIMIRRLVKDVADDLPDKVIIPQPISMSDGEAEEYEKYRLEARGAANDSKSVTLAMLQRLRMYCTHSLLCKEDNQKDPFVKSVKYQRFCEIVEEITERREKVIVFTSYKKMFQIFKEDIPSRFGLEVECINGETDVSKRQQIVDWFNNHEGSAVLILNPRAAGTGLNITGANHVIHYNLEWNPALEDQSSARAYRRGQQKTVFIYRLFYANTVEQIVNERIERKREIAATAVVGTSGNEDDKNDIMRALELAPVVSGKDRKYD